MRSLAPPAAIAGLFHLTVDSLHNCVVFGMHQSHRRSVVTLRKTFAGADQLQFAARLLIDSNVIERWRGTVSDDFTLTRILREANLPIHFTPNCLVPSFGDCGFKELLEFTTRQIKITRVYAQHLWLPLLLGSSLFTIVFFGGFILLILSKSILLPVVLAVLFALGAAKSIIRWRAVPHPWRAAISSPTSFSGPSHHCSISTTPSSRASRAVSNGAE